MNNAAVICKIKNVRPHSNADRVPLGTACGYQVVIGLDIKEGDLGIYFPTDTCLGKDFAAANEDLLTYFGKNLRVRTQKFRGEKSEGFWCGIKHVEDLIGYEPKEGEELTGLGPWHVNGEEVDNLEICKKYVNPATLNRRNLASKIAKKFRSGSLPTFQKHVETQHLRKEWDQIPRDRQWIWTHKVHGTSQRLGYVLVPQSFFARWVAKFRKAVPIPCSKWRDNLSSRNYARCKKLLDAMLWLQNKASNLDEWWNKNAPKMGFAASRYEYVVGSRNVILGELKADGSVGKDSFYSDEFRKQAAAPFLGQLHKGEVVYYEIVGYAAYNSPIMSKVHVKDKDIKKLYGDEVIYTYGCVNGSFDIYVYRIAYQTEDGQSIDLSWDQVKTRCRELGVKHVPECLVIQQAFNNYDYGRSLDLIQEYIEQPDPIDARHPMEGVVLRVEGSKPEFYKEKAFTFKLLEGMAVDSGAVDMEEAS
jgi:hypothetical protein